MDRTIDNQDISVQIPLDLKKCHKCGSVFIEDDFCETCGIRLNNTCTFEPFGNNSFYDLRDDYIEGLGFIFRMFPWTLRFEKTYRRTYVRNLLKRYKDLLEFRGLLDNSNIQICNLCQMEFIELVKELVSYGEIAVIKKILATVTMNGEGEDDVFHNMYDLVIDIAKKNEQERFSFLDLYNLELIQGLRIRFLMFAFAMSIFVVIASLLYYPRLLTISKII